MLFLLLNLKFESDTRAKSGEIPSWSLPRCCICSTGQRDSHRQHRGIMSCSFPLEQHLNALAVWYFQMPFLMSALFAKKEANAIKMVIVIRHPQKANLNELHTAVQCSHPRFPHPLCPSSNIRGQDCVHGGFLCSGARHRLSLKLLEKSCESNCSSRAAVSTRSAVKYGWHDCVQTTITSRVPDNWPQRTSCSVDCGIQTGGLCL